MMWSPALPSEIEVGLLDTLSCRPPSMQLDHEECFEKFPAPDPRASAFDSFPSPAFILNAAGMIIACNAAGATLVEQPAAHVVGTLWREVLDDTEDGTTGASRDRRRILPLRAAGSPGCALLVMDPPQADPASEAQEDSLLLEAAHDLRSLLTSFVLTLGGLTEDASLLDEHLQKALAILERGSTYMRALVENLYDAGSLEAGQFALYRRPGDISALVRETVVVAEPLLQPKRQRIALDLPQEDVVLPMDEQRVRQALHNLIHNSSKYGPTSGTITVEVRLERRYVRLLVGDRGPGIPLEDQSRIFDRHYRGKAARENGAGIGLGLPIAAAVARAHGGEIGVQSAAGVGSTFWFTLPRF